jgi:hypothetical protein
MKQKRRGEPQGARPKVFHPNSWCSEYFLGESAFLQSNLFTPTTKRKIRKQAEERAEFLNNPNVPHEYKMSPSCSYLNQIAGCAELTDSGPTPAFTDEVVKYVVQATKEFGVDALRLNTHDHFQIHPLSDEEIAESWANFHRQAKELVPRRPRETNETSGNLVIQLKRLTMREPGEPWDPDNSEDSSPWDPEQEQKRAKRNPLDYLHPLARAQKEAKLQELRHREGLGPLICTVLRFWREQIQSGSQIERRQATKHLKAFGNALIPETRGKRQHIISASAYEVKVFYLKKLYRLYHAEYFLKSSDGPRNYALRVKQVSKNFQISVELIRELWCLDDDDQPNGNRPIPVKEMARMLTGKKFKITQHRVSNLLSF